MHNLTPLSLFDNFFDYSRRPTVYVISDAQMSEWKRRQAEAEILELDKLIDTHEASIERLKETRSKLRDEYPELTASKENQE